MRIMERWGEGRDIGERWSRVRRGGRHIRRRKKRIIEKQSREGNRTRIWKWREALDSCIISQSFSGGETTSAAFNSLPFFSPKCVKRDIHTLAHHASIPRIGENRMCEVSNNSVHCLWTETDSAGRPERLIYIAHMMRDFTHLRLSHRDIFARAEMKGLLWLVTQQSRQECTPSCE